MEIEENVYEEELLTGQAAEAENRDALKTTVQMSACMLLCILEELRTCK